MNSRTASGPPASNRQVGFIKRLLGERNLPATGRDKTETAMIGHAARITAGEFVSIRQASALIDWLLTYPKQAAPAASSTPAVKPTKEQLAIGSAFDAGKNITTVAAAGSGKTTSLRMLATSAGSSRRGLYLAYNRAIADDARLSFPAGADCMTAHALAFRSGYRERYGHRLKAGAVTGARAAAILKINHAARIGERLLQPRQIAALAMGTVRRFCYSADAEPQPGHVPPAKGIEDPAERDAVRAAVLPWARKAWTDLQRTDGQLKFTHDHYLKMWSLSRPVLPYDYLLYDEAQDANPAVLAVVLAQQGVQLDAVGDPCQAIYGWRGAVDAMDQFPSQARLCLSQSFRFGPAIAEEANKWLNILHAELRVTGFDQVPSVVREIGNPRAILCRTNAGAIEQVMRSVEAGRRPALVGGGGELLALARAGEDLKAGRGTEHPDLIAFTTWAELQDYVEHDEGGADLKVFVSLADRYGLDVLTETLEQLGDDEKRADVVISTAHKAKGREWDTVRVAPDFRPPKPNDDGSPGRVTREDAMLAYVTVTRARRGLDRGGLAWVDDYPNG